MGEIHRGEVNANRPPGPHKNNTGRFNSPEPSTWLLFFFGVFMDKVSKTFQMHFQYGAHIFKRTFIDKKYDIKMHSGISVHLEAKAKHFPHLIGISKNIVFRYGGENIFNMFYFGTDFSVDGKMPSYPISKKSNFSRKVRTLFEIETAFTLFDKIVIVDYDKNKRNPIDSNALDTDILFSKIDTKSYIGFKFDSDDNVYYPNTILNGRKTTGYKYIENQIIELIDSITITNYDGSIENISIDYTENDYFEIAKLIKINNCVLRAPEHIKKLIDKY